MPAPPDGSEREEPEPAVVDEMPIGLHCDCGLASGSVVDRIELAVIARHVVDVCEGVSS